MGYYARLKHGSKHLDLSTAPYELLQGFTPPPPNPTPLLTGGNMLNRYAGGRRVDRSFSDRAMNVPIKISGDSASETHNALRRLASFIETAMMDSSDPLYFVFGENNAIPYEPKWGQQFKYYEVKDATQAIAGLYGVASTHEKIIRLNLPLLVGPFAVGKRQRVGSATGGILEHTWATTDGGSRGLQIPEGTENQMTNPIFGHSTYSNGWTAQADLTISENTDETFVMFGASSVKVIRDASTSNTVLYQSIDCNTDAAAHYISCYAKKPDGGTISSSDAVLYYAGTGELTTTFTAVGDGWYRLTASFTSAAGAQSSGISIKAVAVALYVDGFQLEEKAYPTPLAHGDMLDVAWASTAHASESTRTGSRVRVAGSDVIDVAEGTIRVVWKADFANTGGPATRKFFQDSGDNLRAWYATGTTDFRFADGTNTIDSTAQTFSLGDIIILHFVWEKGSLKIYRAGSQIATGSTYTPPAAPTYLYIGTSSTPDQHSNGTYLDFTTWDRGLSAAEVLADYNNVSEHVTGGDGYGQRLNPVPWLWTDDGDNVLDQYCDSTHENYCVYGGIPGNVPADTIHDIDGVGSGLSVFVSNLAWKDYVDISECFQDLSGHVDAGAVGGEVEQETVTTSSIYPGSGLSTFTNASTKKALSGIPFRIFASVSDAGSNLQIYSSIGTGFTSVSSERRAIVADGTRKDFLTYDAIAPVTPALEYDWINDSSKIFFFYLIRTTGSAVAEIDYTQLFLGDFFYIENVDSNTDRFIVHGTKVIELTASAHADNNKIIGSQIDLHPHNLNHVVVMSGTLAANTNNTNTITLDITYITPRWSIL